MVVGLGEKSCSKVGGIVYILKFLGGLHIGGGGGRVPPPPPILMPVLISEWVDSSA